MSNIKQECRSPKASEDEYGLEMSNEEHITIEPLIEINTESQHLSLAHEEVDPLPTTDNTQIIEESAILNDVVSFTPTNIESLRNKEDDNNSLFITENANHGLEHPNNDLTISIVN